MGSLAVVGSELPCIPVLQVYDESCDDSDSFYLCQASSTWVGSTGGSCIYHKTQGNQSPCVGDGCHVTIRCPGPVGDTRLSVPLCG